MSNNIEMKKTVVADIKSKFERAKTVVLVDYRGLTVAEVTDLRNQLRKAGVEYAVLKNTMINLAIADMGIDGVKAHLEGPTAVAFGYEELGLIVSGHVRWNEDGDEGDFAASGGDGVGLISTQ